jgi:hypothetical protein
MTEIKREAAPALKVGDTIYEANGFNGNVDRKNPYKPKRIVGETRQSWILENDDRVNKQTLEVRHPGYTPTRYVVAEERDRRIYIGANRHELSRKVENCEDVEVLKEIAAIFDREPSA